MTTLTDTHAHLDFPEFEADLPQILANARAAGVTRILTVGTTLESSRRAVEIAHRHEEVFAVIGVHPGHAHEAPDDIINPLRELARHPKVAAIGETGMDFHYLPGGEQTPSKTQYGELGGHAGGDSASIRAGAVIAAQAALFEQQLDLAAELGLNVVIHQRDAWPETLEILAPYAGRVRAVFHCFGGTIDQGRSVIALGHMVSFTGIVTFKNAPSAHESAALVPDDAFMVETDCPYLAPMPFRGKRCEPAHVRLVAENIALRRGATLEEIARQTSLNANAFFRFRAD
jgi:TatD DNase family protein